MASHQSLYNRDQDRTLQEIKKTFELYSEKNDLITQLNSNIINKTRIPDHIQESEREYYDKIRELNTKYYYIITQDILSRQNNPNWNSFCEAPDKISNISQQYRDTLNELIRITSP
jgi:hypothetical protein